MRTILNDVLGDFFRYLRTRTYSYYIRARRRRGHMHVHTLLWSVRTYFFFLL